MLTRFAVPLLVILALACTDPAPSGPNTTPSSTPTTVGMEPVTAGPLSKLVSCDGMPNVGSIVKVESGPPVKLHGGEPFNVFGAIWRDDASWPGVQYYCEDQTRAMTWSITGNSGCLTYAWNEPAPYVDVLQAVCTGPGAMKAIAIPLTKVGGSILSSHRDTTIVYYP
jgi:hypothetical protein